MPEFTDVSQSPETKKSATTEGANIWKTKAEYAVSLASTGTIGAAIYQELAQGTYYNAALLALPLAYSVYRQVRTKEQMRSS